MAASYPPLRFIWNGQPREHQALQPTLAHEPHSWPYDKRPTITATLPATDGSAVVIQGHAERWGEGYVLIRWVDDNDKTLNCWVPAEAVRKLTDSEWDIEEYRRCPPHLRGIRWGETLARISA